MDVRFSQRQRQRRWGADAAWMCVLPRCSAWSIADARARREVDRRRARASTSRAAPVRRVVRSGATRLPACPGDARRRRKGPATGDRDRRTAPLDGHPTGGRGDAGGGDAGGDDAAPYDLPRRPPPGSGRLSGTATTATVPHRNGPGWNLPSPRTGRGGGRAAGRTRQKNGRAGAPSTPNSPSRLDGDDEHARCRGPCHPAPGHRVATRWADVGSVHRGGSLHDPRRRTL